MSGLEEAITLMPTDFIMELYLEDNLVLLSLNNRIPKAVGRNKVWGESVVSPLF